MQTLSELESELAKAQASVPSLFLPRVRHESSQRPSLKLLTSHQFLNPHAKWITGVQRRRAVLRISSRNDVVTFSKKKKTSEPVLPEASS